MGRNKKKTVFNFSRKQESKIEKRHTLPKAPKGELVPRDVTVGSWLVVVSHQNFSKMALTIFFIFCLKVPYYKGKKRSQAFFRKNSRSRDFGPNGPVVMEFRIGFRS